MSVESILAAERKKYRLPIQKLSEFLYTPKFYHQMKTVLETGPVRPFDPNIYNKDRIQLIKDTYKYLPFMWQFNNTALTKMNVHPHMRTIWGLLVNPHQAPGSAHIGMFLKYIDLMGTQEHKAKYLEKCKSYEIVGCYAQTQIGHGSDVRNLQTVATFDEKTKEWVINTPSLSAAKYWPGQLSFLANYAMVFAQTISKGKNQGVFPFLVEIKDKNYDWLPGIEGGDIGPKLGFHAKENGYMLLHNVRIPKNNLLSKYVEVSDDGEVKILGDPRVGYGTMMHIRELISCAVPKVYAQAIIIASRYSLFRKQFRNNKKEEIPVIEYQIQQDKVLSRIAEYYAITVAGTKIRLISEENFDKILKNDFSLLQENHSNLAFSKCLYSEIVHEGMQILRRSIGGHGTSYYSGIPQLLNEYAPNNTHEGENTVMYIQTARYVLKSYANYMIKGKTLNNSVKYIELFSQHAETKLFGNKQWQLDELLIVFLKTIQHVLGVITTRISNKAQGQTELDIINYKIGSRLQQLAQLHANYYTINTFIEAFNSEKDTYIKPVISDLCRLFAINQIHKHSEPIIEAGFICPRKFKLLAQEKEYILGRLRPILVGLLDSFGIPDKYIRSEVSYGNPYNNYLDRARQCELNLSVQESARLVSKFPEVVAKPKAKF